MNIKNLKFDQNGLIPAVVQDVSSKEVLMVAYMNEEALNETIKTGKTVFYSRSRQKLWKKGETSGNFQTVIKIETDCDLDTLLVWVLQENAACHTGEYSCFYTDFITDKKVIKKPINSNILYDVYNVISDRSINPKEGSYTNYLLEKGLDKMLKKVGEEAAEVIIAAKNRDKNEVRYEAADLLYHLSVVLFEQGLTWDEVFAELEKRR